MVGTRRALLGAGAVALLTGCGPPEDVEVRAKDVLARQLRAEQEVAAAHQAIGDVDLSIPDKWSVGSLLQRTDARVTTLAAELRREGGRPEGPLSAPARGGLEGLLEAERRALRVHIQALGELRDPKWGELFGELIAGSAAHETALLEMLKRPPLPSAFPGQPVA